MSQPRALERSNIHELRLLKKLSPLKGKILKGLRFNLPRGAPIVSVTLPKQKPSPVAMVIVRASAGEEYELALGKMIRARPKITPWVWRVEEGDIPRFP